MFKGLFDIASVMKQAQEFGGKMQAMQEQLKSARVKGASGGGMVEVEMSGAMEMLGCKIDPALIARGDTEFLEELLVAAVNEAIEAARQAHAGMMQEATGDMNLPGMDEMLKKFTP